MSKYQCENKTKGRYAKYKGSYELYRKKNKSKINEFKRSKKNYYGTHLKWIKRNRDKWLTYKKRDNAKRRELGFYQLNSYFSGSVGHHINYETIIYIPENMHKSIKHNVFTGFNMEKINKLALDFLETK